jgi:hypothetical protein
MTIPESETASDATPSNSGTLSKSEEVHVVVSTSLNVGLSPSVVEKPAAASHRPFLLFAHQREVPTPKRGAVGESTRVLESMGLRNSGPEPNTSDAGPVSFVVEVAERLPIVEVVDVANSDRVAIEEVDSVAAVRGPDAEHPVRTRPITVGNQHRIIIPLITSVRRLDSSQSS